MYEKYRELSWDLHNSVTSDRVIVNNSRRYFIKASLYRRWSSPTNRTICKHCNICRRLQPRPSISATVSQISPPDFSRNIFDFALSSLYSHSSTARNQSSWWKCPNRSPILSFRQISFSSQIFCTINPSPLDYCNWTWSKHIGIKLKKSFYFDSPREHLTIHFAISFKNIPRIRDYSLILKTPTPIRNSVFSSLRKIFPSMNIYLKKWKSNGNEKM